MIDKIFKFIESAAALAIAAFIIGWSAGSLPYQECEMAITGGISMSIMTSMLAIVGIYNIKEVANG